MGGSHLEWPSLAFWYVTPVVIALALLGVITSLCARGMRRRGLLLLAGLFGAALMASDVQATSMMNYRSHMIEHLVVVLLVAPLVAGATTFKWNPPAACMGFLAFTALVPLFHLTSLGGVVMASPFGHDTELVSFLVVGIVFWIPIYGAGSLLNTAQRVAYITLALPVIATTGLVLWSSSVASIQTTSMNMAAVSINDIHGGGVVMMLWGTVALSVHLGVMLIRGLSESRRQHVPIGRRYANVSVA